MRVSNVLCLKYQFKPDESNYDVRLGMIALKPARGRLVRLRRSLLIANLNFVHFREILLLRRRSSEVPFAGIMIDSLLQHSRRVLGITLAIRLVGFCEGIGGIIGLVEILGLNCGYALEC